MSDLRTDYLQWISKKYKDRSSLNKIRLGFDEFIAFMGDLDLKNLNAHMAVAFAECQLEENTNRSHHTIKDRNWAMGVFTDFCFTKGYMDTNHSLVQSLKTTELEAAIGSDTRIQIWIKYFNITGKNRSCCC